MYFGQKPEEHSLSIKKRYLEVKDNNFLEKKCYLKKGACILNFSRSSRARAGPIWAHKGPKNQKEIRKEFAFIGAFKVPCTLP